MRFHLREYRASLSDQQEFTYLYGNWKFITVFTKACNLSLPLSWDINEIHNLSDYLINNHFNIILPSTLWSTFRI